ncbi:unnamed protein product, partial [Discosporangium mesarthrocarpum]
DVKEDGADSQADEIAARQQESEVVQLERGDQLTAPTLPALVDSNRSGPSSLSGGWHAGMQRTVSPAVGKDKKGGAGEGMENHVDTEGNKAIGRQKAWAECVNHTALEEVKSRESDQLQGRGTCWRSEPPSKPMLSTSVSSRGQETSDACFPRKYGADQLPHGGLQGADTDNDKDTGKAIGVGVEGTGLGFAERAEASGTVEGTAVRGGLSPVRWVMNWAIVFSLAVSFWWLMLSIRGGPNSVVWWRKGGGEGYSGKTGAGSKEGLVQEDRFLGRGDSVRAPSHYGGIDGGSGVKIDDGCGVGEEIDTAAGKDEERPGGLLQGEHGLEDLEESGGVVNPEEV